MFRGNLLYRLLGQNLYPLHRFRLSKSRHRFPRNTLTLISHIITTGSPVLLSDIVTDVATNRIYTGFSPHLHCRTQKRPCQSGRNSEPTKSFSYTYLLRVLPQISFSSQAKGFAPNEDKSFAPGISPVLRQPSLSSFGAKPLSSPPVSALQISTQISSQHLNANIAYNYYRFPGTSLGHRYRCRYKPHIHRLFSTFTL